MLNDLFCQNNVDFLYQLITTSLKKYSGKDEKLIMNKKFLEQ